jgi:hypothetical protein
MLSLVEKSTQNNGILRVDLDVLDSLKKSWLIPKDTGKLVFPKKQNLKYEDRSKSQPNLDNGHISKQ